MNENRSVFALDGITGMLIATTLLLSILGALTYFAIGAQQNNASNFYEIKDANKIEMRSVNNADHRVQVK